MTWFGRIRKHNPYHDPETGRFTTADGAGWPKEDDGKAGKGSEIVVYRLGSQKGGLSGRNGGNADGVAAHLARADDIDAPSFQSGLGDTITAYRVKLKEEPGKYATSVGGETKATAVGRRISGKGVSYSFPASGDGYEAEVLHSVPLSAVRAKLKDMGYSSADDAGTLKTAEAIRAVFDSRRDA